MSGIDPRGSFEIKDLGLRARVDLPGAGRVTAHSYSRS